MLLVEKQQNCGGGSENNRIVVELVAAVQKK